MKDDIEKMKEFEAKGYYTVKCRECGGTARAEIDASWTVCTDCDNRIEVKPVV